MKLFPEWDQVRKWKPISIASYLGFWITNISVFLAIIFFIYQLKSSREALNTLTGGDSFCYLVIGFHYDNNLFYSIRQEGDYNLYDVYVTIEELERRTILMDKAMSESSINDPDSDDLMMGILEKTTFYKDLGMLRTNSVRVSEFFKVPPDQDHLRWHITISARNGYFSEYIYVLNIHSKPIIAFRVYRNGKVIKESIPDDFPRDSYGIFAQQ